MTSGDMTIILSIISLLLTVFIIFDKLKRNSNTDIKDNAEKMSTIIIKLESLDEKVDEMRDDVKSVHELRTRVTVLERMSNIKVGEKECQKLIG